LVDAQHLVLDQDARESRQGYWFALVGSLALGW
jgi:hypothetical protein